MKKTKSIPFLLVLALLLVISPTFQAHAKVQSFEALYMEVTIPDNTVVLSKDTPNTDEAWVTAGILDPDQEKDTFSDMGVQAILYDPDTDTTVRVLQNKSTESSEVFNLTLLSDEEQNEFLNGLISAANDTTTYSVEKFEHPEVPYFRVNIEMTVDNVVSAEIIYGTVVNGAVISYDIYDDTLTEPMDETYVKELVAGTHFTEFLDKAEVEKQGRNATIFFVVSAIILIGFVVLLIWLTAKRNKKQEILRKKKSEEMTKFFKEQSLKEEQHVKDPILFTNHTVYSEEVVKQFCYYDIILHHIMRWIFTGALYLLLMFSLSVSSYAMIGYIVSIVVLFVLIFFQGLQVEKTIKKIMKTYERSKSMEAIFHFYDDYCSLSGIQSASKYPYAQITEVKEYKNYIYLYLGTEKALYLNKEGFQTSAEEFKTFIMKKISSK